MRAPTVLWVLVMIFVALQMPSILWPNLHWLILSLGAFQAGEFADAVQNPTGSGRTLLTLVTHSFLHGGIVHLLFNSLAFLFLGTAVALRLGTVRFLILYVVSAAAGALMHGLLVSSDAYVIGSSGVVFALAAAHADGLAAAHDLQRSVRLRFLARQAVGWMIANALIYAALYLLAERSGGQGALAAWRVHLGGYMAGAFLTPLLARGRYLRRS